MISRATARLVANLVARTLRSSRSIRVYGSATRYYDYNDGDEVYDFFFDNDYPAYLCNAARKACRGSTTSTRPLTDFLMKLHTGESLATATEGWSWEQRRKLGQKYLQDLAEDILTHSNAFEDDVKACRRRLELDGFTFKDSKILAPESDVLETKEEAGVLESLYAELNLANKDTAVHHLSLSEEHYMEKRWDDSISNSRKFLECVMQEIAASYSVRIKQVELDNGTYTRPVRVRDYLEREGLLETKEKEAIASVYGLLSQTGGHPYMAQDEQARLLRHLALTFSQFAMLRFKGKIGSGQ
jgi:hypothetical protein